MLSFIYVWLVAISTIPVIPKSETGHDWIPTIGAIIISVVTAAGTIYQNRRKGKNDQFKAFMDESSEFRDEIRKERENLKKELTDLYLEKTRLQRQNADYEKELESCTRNLHKYKEEMQSIRAQMTSLAENRKFKEIVNALPHIVWVTDGKGNAKYYNSKAHQYVGAPYITGLEFKYLDYFHPDDVKGFLAVWEECIKTGKKYIYEYRMKRADGAYRWNLGLGLPILDIEGNIVEWVGTSSDIHDIKLDIIEKCKKDIEGLEKENKKLNYDPSNPQL